MKYEKIGVIIADRDEYLPFVNVIKDAVPYGCFGMPGISFSLGGVKITAVCCGIGKVNAATAATALAAAGNDAILNFGLSGGIHGVRKGELNLPKRFLEHDFDMTGIGYKPCEKPGQQYIYNADENISLIFMKKLGEASRGTAVSGDSFICDETRKNALYTAFGAATCDMETAAIASVCHAAGLPFVALRRVSDDAGDEASKDYRQTNQNEGDVLSDAFFSCLSALCLECGG